jgi:FkbM family methyltransferase
MSSVRGWTILNDIAPVIDIARAGAGLPTMSWSQDGEDVILSTLITRSSTYVDVGAHHPHRFSVTHRLYEHGWSGVNIDASPGFRQLFDTERPTDINIEALVGEPGHATFYQFSDPAYSTIDERQAEEVQARGVPLLRTDPVTVHALAELLHAYLTPQPIGLLSVDVEGADLAVLRSHDWNAFPVERVLIECRRGAQDDPDPGIIDFLTHLGYREVFRFRRSLLFEATDPHPAK